MWHPEQVLATLSWKEGRQTSKIEGNHSPLAGSSHTVKGNQPCKGVLNNIAHAVIRITVFLSKEHLYRIQLTIETTGYLVSCMLHRTQFDNSNKSEENLKLIRHVGLVN